MSSTPENITHLEPEQIFVFGSNLGGQHVGGAAAQAYQDFGAEWGVGEGLCGQTYAFPTLDEKFHKLPKDRLERCRDDFFQVAEMYPDLIFLLTKVGCGIANYKEWDMIELFKYAPINIVKPDGW